MYNSLTPKFNKPLPIFIIYIYINIIKNNILLKKKIPKQKEGTILNTQERAIPKFSVDSIILKTKIISGSKAPTKKFKKNAAI